MTVFFMELFDRVQGFLSGTNGFMDLAMAKKGELFLGYHSGDKGLNMKRNCFEDDFVNVIAE